MNGDNTCIMCANEVTAIKSYANRKILRSLQKTKENILNRLWE